MNSHQFLLLQSPKKSTATGGMFVGFLTTFKWKLFRVASDTNPRSLKTIKFDVFFSEKTTPLKIMKINILHIIPWRFGSDHFPFFSWVMAVGEPAVNFPGYLILGNNNSRKNSSTFMLWFWLFVGAKVWTLKWFKRVGGHQLNVEDMGAMKEWVGFPIFEPNGCFLNFTQKPWELWMNPMGVPFLFFFAYGQLLIENLHTHDFDRWFFCLFFWCFFRILPI